MKLQQATFYCKKGNSSSWLKYLTYPNDFRLCITTTVHELAHQCWEHQIATSNTQGSNQISESMAKYTSIEF